VVTRQVPERKEEQIERIIGQLGEIGHVLPGSIVERYNRCGKAACRCKADPPQLHGPYRQWTNNTGGDSTTRLLSTEQVERYRSWFEEARRLRELVRELEALCVEAAEYAEGWAPPKRRSPTAQKPRKDKKKEPRR
jgi:hypothetical protein